MVKVSINVKLLGLTSNSNYYLELLGNAKKYTLAFAISTIQFLPLEHNVL